MWRCGQIQFDSSFQRHKQNLLHHKIIKIFSFMLDSDRVFIRNLSIFLLFCDGFIESFNTFSLDFWIVINQSNYFELIWSTCVMLYSLWLLIILWAASFFHRLIGALSRTRRPAWTTFDSPCSNLRRWAKQE